MKAPRPAFVGTDVANHILQSIAVVPIWSGPHSLGADPQMAKKRQHPRESDRPEGKYANYFEIGHAASEFLIDIAQFYQDWGKARFHTRIVTSPQGAKALQETLRKSLDEYEKTYGIISPEDEQEVLRITDEE